VTTAVTMAAAELGLAAIIPATAFATSSAERPESEATKAAVSTGAALSCANETVGTLKSSRAARRDWV